MLERRSYQYTGNPGILNHIVIYHRADEHTQCQRFRKKTAQYATYMPYTLCLLKKL